MHYVYILFSLKDKKLYTGSTADLKERLSRHNRGLVAATKNRRPLKLIYYEACLNRKDSMRRELYLKTAWGKRYLKNRLTNFYKEDSLRILEGPREIARSASHGIPLDAKLSNREGVINK